MKFYKVDHQGKHLLQRLNAAPPPVLGDKGRLYFDTVVGGPFVSDGASNYELVKADGKSYNIIADEATIAEEAKYS